MEAEAEEVNKMQFSTQTTDYVYDSEVHAASMVTYDYNAGSRPPTSSGDGTQGFNYETITFFCEEPAAADSRAFSDFTHVYQQFSAGISSNTQTVYYYGYRYYMPEIGKWISSDPISEWGGYNLYGYIGNDSVNDWDAKGLLFGLGKQNWKTCSKGMVWTYSPVPTIPKADGCSNPFAGWIGKKIGGILPVPPYSGNPDAPWESVSFSDACNFHDYCYSNCNKTKDDCDKGLRDRAKKACEDSGIAKTFTSSKAKKKWLDSCNQWAEVYYKAVKSFAGDAYKDRQKQACGCYCFKNDVDVTIDGDGKVYIPPMDQ